MSGSAPTLLLQRLEELRAPLEDVGARYAVIGDLATSYWSVPDLSSEIELAVEVVPGAASSVCQWFTTPDQAALVASGLRAPVLVVKYFRVGTDWEVTTGLNDSAFLTSAIDRRITVEIAGSPTPLVTAEDILLLQLLDWRDRARIHLDDLLLVVGPLDDAYLAAWADKLGVRDRLEEQWRRSGRELRA